MSKAPPLAAAIDLGSNSFHLLIGRLVDQELHTLARKRMPLRLAQGLGQTGLFANDRLEAALAALASFRREIEQFPVARVRCCGTEALRRAANRHSLIGPGEGILGHPIEILTGSEEALLCSQGVTGALADKLSFPCLIADVGGGSSELIHLNSLHSPPTVVSLACGAVTLAEASLPARKRALTSLTEQLKTFLKGNRLEMLNTVVGTGGTASTLAALAQQLVVYDSSKINGFVLSRSQLEEISLLISRLPLGHRQNLTGLEAGREGIIGSGLEIYQEILATIAATGMIVSDAGLLEGILHSITAS